ncbi:MAG: 1-acyl-sn-glycerol-3-phosphate acyltransferase [Actinobacteria bacterium]|nr:1-acyl-sn-glycerol-3-phosphate acyltransferase [Actinomycetota bacterium]
MAYAILKAILLPLLSLIFRPKVEGLSHVPTHGAAIIASNHLSFSDSIFMPLVVPRRVTFLAKSEYFTGETGLRILREGNLLGIYPEGTRSPDGRLYRGRTGIARMALESGVPVIPVAMIDTDKIQPPGKALPKIMQVGIRFGEPLDFSRYEGMSGDRFILRSVTDEIMYALMDLGGQEYVDMYATRAKQIEADETKGNE